MKVKPLNSPEKIFVALTSRCNLECKHCNVFPFRASGTEFTLAEWSAFFRRIADLKVLSVWLSGGEPFCREDLFDILDIIHGKPIHVGGLNTNATLIDAAKAARIASYPKLGIVQVGLDGASAATHDRLRGRGVFDRAVRGIANLIRAGKAVSLFAAVTRINRGELRGIAKLAAGLGVSGVTLSMLLPQGRALHFQEELALGDDEWRAAVVEAGALADEFPGLLHGSMVDACRMFAGFGEKPPPAVRGAGPFLTGCKTGITECTVMSDGRVLPCDRLQDVVAGNLRDADFQEIWLRSPVFADFRSRFEVRLEDLDTCRGCRFQALCTGGCPAIPFYTEGTLLARDKYSCYRFFANLESPHPGRAGIGRK